MGTNLKCGILGLPNVGKSTFFNVLTKTQIAAAENLPFCTIDPNESRVPVPDARFDFLVDFHKPASKVPAFLNVTDIAGLVKGASEGQGLGNAFLSHIKACDALLHLCRTFEDKEITHIEGEVDPVRDLDIINEELRLKDVESFTKYFEDLEKRYTRGEKKLKLEYDTFCKVKKTLIEEEKHIRFGTWSGNDIEFLNKHLFITAKPMIYLVNLSEKDYIRKKNKWLPKIKEYVDKHDPRGIVIHFPVLLSKLWWICLRMSVPSIWMTSSVQVHLKRSSYKPTRLFNSNTFSLLDRMKLKHGLSLNTPRLLRLLAVFIQTLKRDSSWLRL
uniref:Obg-like ATPase 1 n=1 Tax=Lepeophtheirus salmonis TaxID=72036 RepID=C1BUV9_LEPSM|nr:Obg-like ATPase 1 [Lepeophtheirus salmonis]